MRLLAMAVLAGAVGAFHATAADDASPVRSPRATAASATADDEPSPPPSPAPSPVVRALDPAAARLHAVLVNGGARREMNYGSHLQHVRSMVALLDAAGVPHDRVTIFTADGDDPAADLATREPTRERGGWLLPSHVAGLLGPIDYVNTTVDGFTLKAAKLAELKEWFDGRGRELRPGDTLLFYVTDHGEKNADDLANNTISLWGEKLPVSDLQDMLATLDPGVRVVLLMSQCFSGAFSRLMYRHPDDTLPAGSTCGFFSVTRDRPAYGCYPENRGKDGVGHSYHFMEAAADLGRFSESHRRVLVTDDSPDVPLTTLDAYYDRMLRDAADEENRETRSFVDALIADAWRRPGAFEPEIRLLDRIGQAFGSFSPRSLAELDEQARALPELSARVKTYADRWQQTYDALRVENFARFMEAHPEWRNRITAKTLGTLGQEDRRKTTRALLAALVPFTGHDATRHARLLWLKQKADAAEAAHYRAEVRVGAVLRLRAVLFRVAGAVLAERSGGPQQAAARALADCEAFSLRTVPPTLTAASLPSPPSFPPLADDQQLLTGLLPAYMGIEFRPLDEAKRVELGVQKGAVNVMRVYTDSPAERAGLEVGDVVLGPPGAPFEEPNQVREWTMRRQIDVPTPLEIRRGAGVRTITLKPGPFPLELPKLPGPPKVGSVAPKLELELFRGKTDLAAPRGRLLFFWATWCTICKEALPEVIAYAQTHDVDVVAITDEPASVLEPFFRDFKAPFPEIVALDPLRRTFESYGVSGTPTFAIVDRDGVVRAYQTGYPPEGLKFEGWHWREDVKKLSSH